MFNKDYSFRGKHAEMVIELTSSFDEKNNKLFMRNLDVYIVAPIIGFLFRRTAEMDSSGKQTNILFDAMSKETTTLWFNYRLIMLLDLNNDPDFNKRVEKAFRHYGTDQAKSDEEIYESYVRGGIELLHEKLMKNISSPEDYIKNLYEFMEEFEGVFGQCSDEILNLVQLARE